MAKTQEVREGFDLTDRVILGFSSLLKPEAYEPGRPVRFKASLWIPNDSEDLPKLKAALARLAKQRFGKTEGLSWPLQSGTAFNAKRVEEDKSPVVFANDKHLVRAHSGEMKRPALAIAGRDKSLYSREEQEPFIGSHFYNGAEVKASITLCTYEGFGGGVCAYLSSIWSSGKGERLGIVDDPAAKFGGHTGHATNVDPIGEDISF